MRRGLSIPQIRKEYTRWLRAKRGGYLGDIVWSDEEGYEKYLASLLAVLRQQQKEEFPARKMLKTE